MNINVQSRTYPFEMEYSVVGLTCTIIIKMLLDQEHLTFFLLLNQLLMIMMIVWIRALFHVWILTV